VPLAKTSIVQLARFGGPKAFEAPLHVGCPNLPDRQVLYAKIGEILDRRWLTNDGPCVREFEKRVAELAGVEHCVAMANGTVALEIAARAAGLAGEVIVPSYTFVATAHALAWQEIAPVFADVDLATHNLDPASVESKFTPRTTGIVAVHLWGRPCHVEALADLAGRRGAQLLFDASHALGCTHGGRPIGSFGLAEVFSFHATKFLNTCEGGAVTTNDAELARKLRLARNFGFTGYDQVECLGTNGKMSEFSAAMGLASLDQIESFVAANRVHYLHYARRLAAMGGLGLVSYAAGERCNYQYIVVEVDAEAFGLSRDQIVELLWDENVRARRYFFPGCHRMPPSNSPPHESAALPATELLASRVMLLPTGTAVSAQDVDRICDLLAFFSAHAAEIRDRLGALA
jgi:dTDP-4-amino-4,6-dideoxygalactose transaminase